MFTVYHSNQLDLLKTLITVLMTRQPLHDPFQQDVVLVQSPGIAQWLQMQLAQQFGIAANIEFPLPATFIWDMFAKVLPGIPKESAFSKEAMTWKLMWLLPNLLNRPAFAALKHYLTDDNDKCKVHQLAAKVADLFDQYLVYRPAWLRSWERNQLITGLDESQQWQAPLWVALTDYTRQLKQPEWHRANLYEHFIYKLHNVDTCPEGLPKRVFILGISTLPPTYLQSLQALGKHIDIHLMFTNPCRYFWGDIQNYAFLAKLKTRRRRHYAESSVELNLFRNPPYAEQLFNSDGEQNLSNPLLASWGRQGRDHMYLLSQLDEIQEIHAFVDIKPDNLLHGVQHDMLELEDHSITGNTPETLTRSDKKRLLDPADHSISLHVCHSPQREIEVLHDQLLTILSEDIELTPRDIIVMVADIDSYTPYIQAVFGNMPPDRYLPFAISDRKVRHAHPVLQAFITLLDLPQNRFTAEQVLTLLDVPALAGKFGIKEADLRCLRRWVEESGIRWGLDDDNVQELSLPVTGQYTWQFGLTRMLLGYAMDSRVGAWQGVLPYDESSGLSAELAGQLAELLMQLSRWRKQLNEARQMAEWLPVCHQLLDTFFEQDSDTEIILTLIEQQWQRVITCGITAHYANAVSLTLIRNELTARFDNERISQRFLAGSINFCTLMPMRSIPFKVVCLLGMNDGVYPRTLLPLGFDLMARQVQRGDRSRRDDDRYLFLEAILSAQHRLYISYIGQLIQDNSQLYPSVLVSELIDYISQSYRLPKDEALDVDSSAQRVVEHIRCCHSRTPFAEENFMSGSRQQSYAAEWLPVAQTMRQAGFDFNQLLSVEPLTEISLDDLMRFYRHPIKAFFQMRLGVNFVIEETRLRDEEPFVLDNLSCYQFNVQLLDSLIEQKDAEALFARSRASGQLPFGSFGEIFWQKQQQEMVSLAQQVCSERGEIHSLELNIIVGNLHVKGWINQVQMDGLLRWRPAKLTAVDGLLLWLEHLVYCLAGGTGESRMYGRRDKGQLTKWHFAPLSKTEALKHFNLLIEGYQQGLCRPLLLLIKSGWAWLKHCYERHSEQILWDEETQAIARAKLLQAWSDDWVSGEGQDPYVQRVLPVMNENYLKMVLQETERYLLPIARHNLS